MHHWYPTFLVLLVYAGVAAVIGVLVLMVKD